MSEIACQFGPGNRLAGVISAPVPPDRKVACLFVSAGLVPKFGPFRLYALIARRLAQSGTLSLRFDLGGIGDSGQDYAGTPLKTRTSAEIKAAVDYVAERYPVEGFVLCGLCSGAEDSFRYAEADPRVRGVVMIDPFSYPTRGSGVRYLIHRLIRRTLRALGVYRPAKVRVDDGAQLAGAGGTLVNYKYMEFEESSRVLNTLLARGVRLQFLYTGAAVASFNHPGQLQKMFPGVDFRGLVTVEHLPRMAHTQILREDRETIVRLVEQWFARVR